MKKTVSFLLAMIMCLSLCCPAVFAAEADAKVKTPPVEDIKQLRALFTKTDYDGQKYACFSPVKDENDTTKYPLIIYLHGFGHELTFLSDSFMPYWASEKLQAKFTAGGAHIILPRIFFIANKWEKLQALVEDYVSKNEKNIDPDCIVVIGSSMGGAKAFKLLVNTPGYYSAAIISCPANTPKTEMLAAAAGTPIWLLSAKRDFLTGKHEKSWSRILEATSVPEMCNWMFVDGALHGPNGKWRLAHSMSKLICYDGVMFDEASFDEIFDDISTVNGAGEKVEVTWEHGIIDWIERASALKAQARGEAE